MHAELMVGQPTPTALVRVWLGSLGAACLIALLAGVATPLASHQRSDPGVGSTELAASTALHDRPLRRTSPPLAQLQDRTVPLSRCAFRSSLTGA